MSGKCMQKEGWSENLKRGNHLGDLDVKRRIILKMYLRVIGCKGVNWIHLAEHTVQCQTYKHSNLSLVCVKGDRLCGLVVRVSGYRYRGPGFDPRRYQIF